MPFDGTNTTPSLSLTMLAEILRDRSRWPGGFVWDYSHCCTCAMGMAWKLWKFDYSPHSHNMARNFGMKWEDATSIFTRLAMHLGRSEYSVTPEDVASAIDAYLARTP